MAQTSETHLSLLLGIALAQARADGPPPDIPYRSVSNRSSATLGAIWSPYQNTVVIQSKMFRKSFQVFRMIE